MREDGRARQERVGEDREGWNQEMVGMAWGSKHWGVKTALVVSTGWTLSKGGCY